MVFCSKRQTEVIADSEMNVNQLAYFSCSIEHDKSSNNPSVCKSVCDRLREFLLSVMLKMSDKHGFGNKERLKL